MDITWYGIVAPLTLKGSSMMFRAAVLPPLVATYKRLCVASTAVLYSVWPGAGRSEHLHGLGCRTRSRHHCRGRSKRSRRCRRGIAWSCPGQWICS